MNNNYVLIMAGGVGSRFWPKSRNDYPKQFLDILGIGKSLLQLTYERFLKLTPRENIFIVTNLAYENIVNDQLSEIDAKQVICEPSRNNTAPCIAYASFKIQALNPNAKIVVAPSDHFILYEDVFLESVSAALNFAAKHDSLITLGINPTRADTGYGYIKYEKEHTDSIHIVLEFSEKPTAEKANEFLTKGNYVWNAGIFVWSVSAILKAFKTHALDIFQLFSKGREIYNTELEKDFINVNYPLSPEISVDYAILEKATNVYTLPVEIGWSDLGTWGSLFDTAPKNEHDNVISGERVKIDDCHGNIIHINNSKVAVLKGLNDFIVVDEGNALLIYPRSQEQEIKSVVKHINDSFGPTYC